MKCPFCKSEIHPDASVCASCGATYEIEKNEGRSVLGCGCLLPGFLILIIVFAFVMSGEMKPGATMLQMITLGIAMILIGVWILRRGPTKKHWVHRGGNR